MTTQAIETRPAALVPVVMMDETEARAAIGLMRAELEQVDVSLRSFRRRALEFKEREGWRALGYAGYLEAIQQELRSELSRSYISRLVQAAEVERDLDLPMGKSEELPERQLRALGALSTPEERREAWDQAGALAGDKPPATRHVQQAVEDTFAFKDAAQRFAALGWRLERYGLWYRLKGPGSDPITAESLDGFIKRLEQLEHDAAQPAPPAEHEIVRTIREKAAALGLELAWEDDTVLLYWPDEIDDLDQMDGLSYAVALEWLEGDALSIAASRAKREPTTTTAATPQPALCACGKASTSKQTIGGVSELRCDACAVRAERDDLAALLGEQYQGIARDRGDSLDGRTHRVHWATGGGGDYTYAEVLERIAAGRSERAAPVAATAELAALCERAEAVGATIDYLALKQPDRVRVTPPTGYQQRPLDCDAADLLRLVSAWETPAQFDPPALDARAKLLRQWRAVESLLDQGDTSAAEQTLLSMFRTVRGAPCTIVVLPPDAVDRVALAASIRAITAGVHHERVEPALSIVRAVYQGLPESEATA